MHPGSLPVCSPYIYSRSLPQPGLDVFPVSSSESELKKSVLSVQTVYHELFLQ